LYAFDLLELDGKDLRCEPIERRKHALEQLLAQDRAGLLISHPIDAPADVAFKHICQLGLGGIVSKQLGSRYESGRSSLWLKTINPDISPCVPYVRNPTVSFNIGEQHNICGKLDSPNGAPSRIRGSRHSK
jgi:ATP-dependent DNA ligase